MKIKVNSYFGLFIGIAFMVVGGYYLNRYFKKQAVIEKYGKEAWTEERIGGQAKAQIVEVLLVYTWWAPLGITLLGVVFCVASFLKDEDKNQNGNKNI